MSIAQSFLGGAQLGLQTLQQEKELQQQQRQYDLTNAKDRREFIVSNAQKSMENFVKAGTELRSQVADERALDGLIKSYALEIDRTSQMAALFGGEEEGEVLKHSFMRAIEQVLAAPTPQQLAQTEGLAERTKIETGMGRQISDVEAQRAFGIETPASLVTINEAPEAKRETKFQEKLGELDAERVTEIYQSADSARSQIGELDRMQAALDSGRFTPGAFGEERAWLSQVAELLNLNPTDIGLGLGDPATADTLDAASKTIAAEAAKDLGRITNMSLSFLRDSLPALTRTPEGNRIILEVLQRKARRAQQASELTDRYLREFQSIRPDDAPSLDAAIAQLDQVDPLITPELRDRIEKGSRNVPERAEGPRQLGSGGGTGTEQPTELPTFTMKDVSDAARATGKTTDQIIEEIAAKVGVSPNVVRERMTSGGSE